MLTGDHNQIAAIEVYMFGQRNHNRSTENTVYVCNVYQINHHFRVNYHGRREKDRFGRITLDDDRRVDVGM